MSNTVATIWIMSFLVIVMGWIINIVKIFDHGFDSGVTIEVAFRIIGVFMAPIGAIMGYFV